MLPKPTSQNTESHKMLRQAQHAKYMFFFSSCGLLPEFPPQQILAFPRRKVDFFVNHMGSPYIMLFFKIELGDFDSQSCYYYFLFMFSEHLSNPRIGSNIFFPVHFGRKGHLSNEKTLVVLGCIGDSSGLYYTVKC